MNLLLLLPREDDVSALVFFFLFVVFPLLARLLRWLKERAGTGGRVADSAASPARTGEEQRRAEEEGEELWRRLARGELPPEEVASEPFPPPAPARSLERPAWDHSLEEASTESKSMEDSRVPEPLSVLGSVEEPSEAPEVSLERGTERTAFGALALALAAEAPPEEEAPPPRRRRFARSDLAWAIVQSEILGPPVSERPLRA